MTGSRNEEHLERIKKLAQKNLDQFKLGLTREEYGEDESDVLMEQKAEICLYSTSAEEKSARLKKLKEERKHSVRQVVHKAAQNERIQERSKKIAVEDPLWRDRTKDSDPINDRDPKDCLRTPLHKAVANNNIEAVMELLDKGARTDIKDISGCTPYMLALQKGFEEIAMFLEM